MHRPRMLASKKLATFRPARPVRPAIANGAPTLVARAFHTDLGWMAVAGGPNALVGIVFGHPSRVRAEQSLRRYAASYVLNFAADAPPWMNHLINLLARYAAGEPIDFSDVPLDLAHLTPFARRVVAACRRIEPGRVRSYGELARECGSPGAARAVGSVMAKNRFPLIIPCHRVVGAAGSLGGYSAPDGLRMKRRLLTMEGFDR